MVGKTPVVVPADEPAPAEAPYTPPAGDNPDFLNFYNPSNPIAVFSPDGRRLAWIAGGRLGHRRVIVDGKAGPSTPPSGR